MSVRPLVAALVGVMTLGGLTAGCSSPARPTLRREASRPESCAAAVAAAFPDGHPGTLTAYREVERLCPSLTELSRRHAFAGSILRLDCAPADVLALGGEIPQLGRQVPNAPADLIDRAVCRQFNRECADYDELRREHAARGPNPPGGQPGLYVPN